MIGTILLIAVIIGMTYFLDQVAKKTEPRSHKRDLGILLWLFGSLCLMVPIVIYIMPPIIETMTLK